MPNFIAPLAGRPRVTSGWAFPREYRNGIHEGLDFPTPVGSPVLAVASGTVRSINMEGASYAGRTVFIEHPEGWVSGYAHLSAARVQKGDAIYQGQHIADSGDTGAGPAHLHFGFRLPKEKLYLYSSLFGVPRSGFAPDGVKGGLYAVPSEPLIPARYSPTVIMHAQAQGVPIYSGGGLSDVLLVAAVGFVAYQLIS